MKDKNLLYNFTKVIIDIMFYAGIVVCVLLPFLFYKIDGFEKIFELPRQIKLQGLIVLEIAGIMSVFALNQIRQIFKTLVNANPFIIENVKYLRKIAFIAFVVAIDFVAKSAFWLSIGNCVIVVIFIVAGLFCLVLADVFEQAVNYKQEADLTI
jgi:hypothetical protein